jgi:hypothetical protein
MTRREKQMRSTPPSGHGPWVALALLLSLCRVAFASPAAFAAEPEVIGGRPGGYPVESGPGGFAGGLRGVAVSAREQGAIYVLNDGTNQRVAEFKPDGEFVRAFGWGIVPGAASGSGDLTVGSNLITDATTASGEFMHDQILTGPGIPANDRIVRVLGGRIELTRPPTASTENAPLTVTAGPGNVPTDEVQKLTVNANGGQYKLQFRSPLPNSESLATAAIQYNAPASKSEGSGSVEAALEALPNIGSGNVSVRGGPGDAGGTLPYLVEFSGRYTDANVHPLLVAESSLSGGASEATVSTQTEGGGTLETCTTVCQGEARDQPGEEGSQQEPPTGAPGQNTYPDEIAVDNDPTSAAYGDVYVVDQRDYRVQRYSPEGQFELMFGGEVDRGPHHPGGVCTAQYIAEGDRCGRGVPGSGAGFFSGISLFQGWNIDNENAIAIGPDGTVYIGDFRRIEEFSPQGTTGLTYQGELELPSAQMISSLAVDSESHVYANSLAADNAQDLLIPSSGNYELCFEGQCTQPLSTDAGSKEIAEALAALSTIGEGNVSVTTPNRTRVTFLGPLAHGEIPLITATGGTSVEWAIHGGTPQLVKLAGPKAANPSEVLVTYDEGGEPIHIALDEQGDLFTNDFTGGFIRPSCSFDNEQETCPEARFRAFKPDGTLYAIFTSPRVLTISPNFAPFSLAFSPTTGNLYAPTVLGSGGSFVDFVVAVKPPSAGPPLVLPKSETVGDTEPTTTVLHVTVNPHGFDTHYQAQYVTQQHYEAEGFENPQQTPRRDLGAIIQDDPVSVPLANLQPGTTYRWRLFVESECNGVVPPAEPCVAEGEVAEFSTLPPVSVRDLTTQTVGPELVTLKAELNPNNGVGTEYTFRYGDTQAYEGGSLRNTLPLGGEYRQVAATFSGLQSNTTYHYQLVVKNSYGQEQTADQTFTTELSPAEELTAEDCPVNGSVQGAEGGSTLREEDNSLLLPDCRAYEQVSEREKNGGQVFKEFSLAPSGSRAYYFSGGIFAGAEQDGVGAQYFTHRTESGWRTEPAVVNLAQPPTVPLGVSNANPELDRWLLRQEHGLSSTEPLNATSTYFSMGVAGAGFILHASPVLAPLEGGPRGPFAFSSIEAYSEDLSRLYILTAARLLPEDPRPDDSQGRLSGASVGDRIYEISGVGTASAALRLVAELPPGLEYDESGRDHCAIDPTFTFVQRGGTPRFTSASGSTLIYTAPVETTAGLPCGEGTPNPYGIFARAGASPPLQLNVSTTPQCTAGNPCFESQPTLPIYDTVSSDGRRVWFTTKQPLVNADTDETNDLYVAKLNPGGELEELLLASAGEATQTHPAPGTGADLGEDGVGGTRDGVLAVSEDGTHAAFESPAVLSEDPNALGQKPVRHANNVYVYDLASGKTKFVTELCSGPERSGSEPGPFPQGDHRVSLEQSVPDPACPNASPNIVSASTPFGDLALWMFKAGVTGNVQNVAITPDGRFLLFSSIGHLTSDDLDERDDLFRYDFQTGQLNRVSIGRRGNDSDGNDNAYVAEFAAPNTTGSSFFNPPGGIGEDGVRAISADGSTVLFRTPAPLVSRDTNQTSAVGGCEELIGIHGRTGCDIYEWDAQGHGTCTEAGGCVDLISSGRAPRVGDTAAVISASGRDILFVTNRNLVPDDTDGVSDIYDARVEGGFHPEHGATPCGSPETCGEALKPAPAPPVLGTPNFVGPGNSATQLECAKGRHRVVKHGQPRCVPNRHHKGHRGKHYRHHHRTGRNGGRR